ncbi:hypothetical protein APHAL10511_003258 [Amanita phalloides]|nr:hypothetical protein APHAL10511_003258 [Amanita phalloides]
MIANNKSGFLGTSRDRDSEILSDDRDLVLSRGKYYYHLRDNSMQNYPIVTEFDAWTPPSELPQHWRDVIINNDDPNGGTTNLAETIDTSWTIISQKVKDADVYCAMTRASSRLDACHLVPKASVDWYYFDYPAPNINNPQNIITLRTDLNSLGIEQGHFVFVPIKGRLAVYFITKGLLDLVLEFHCRCIHLPVRTSLECLYYRFALSVFESIKPWIPKFSKRVTRVPVPDSVLEHREGNGERKGTNKRKHMAAVNDNCSQLSKLDSVEMEDIVDNASSQSGSEVEYMLDSRLSWGSEEIPWADHPMIQALHKNIEDGWPQFPDISELPLDWPGDTSNGLRPDCLIAPDPED